jgi:hypothetical protein
MSFKFGRVGHGLGSRPMPRPDRDEISWTGLPAQRPRHGILLWEADPRFETIFEHKTNEALRNLERSSYFILASEGAKRRRKVQRVVVGNPRTR